VLKELFDGHFYISLNGAKKPRSDCLSRVDRNHCRPPIRMFQERVAGPSSNDVEAKSFQECARRPCPVGEGAVSYADLLNAD